MSSYPLVKFVDSPAVGATVRLDLNDRAATAPRGVEADFDPGVPTLEGDPDAVGQQWGFRSPRLTVQIKGTKANALAFVSNLSKEMLRRTNWVMFQLNAATAPVWFKTYRTGYQPLSMEQVFGNTTTGGSAAAGFPDVWRVDVPLVADAFMYGARVSITQAQIIQAPADLTGPTRLAMHYVLPTIKGDAPAPLRVTITPAATQNAGALSSWLIGTVCGTTAMVDTVVDIGTGDGLTAGTGTAAATADASYFGGSYRAVTIGAGSGVVTRLSGPFPALPPGRYKIMGRCEADGSTTSDRQYLFRLGTGSTISTDLVKLPSVSVTIPSFGAGPYTYRGWVDLGELGLPMANTPSRDLPDAAPSASPTFPGVFTLDIGAADGLAAAVRLDALKVIPIDGPTVSSAYMLSAYYPGAGFQPVATTSTVRAPTFDGDSESTWLTVSGTSITTGTLSNRVQLQGKFPMVDPACDRNLLIVMATSQGNSTSATSITALNAQVAIDASYYPRYLHIGDGT